jgi:hypothetical protein
MTRLRRHIPFLLWLTLAYFCVAVSTAQAQSSPSALIFNYDLECTGGEPSSSLFDNREMPEGSALGVCATESTSIFQRVVCIFESALGEVIARLFCAVQENYMDAFGAAVVLFVAVFGFMFLTGIVNFTLKEVSINLFKLALVVAFGFNIDFVLNFSYRLFFGAAQQTVAMFELSPGVDAATQGMSRADDFVERFNTYLQLGRDPNDCRHGMIAFFLGLAVFAPFVFLVFFLALISVLQFFARAAFAYFYALTLITFLIALSPIFVSFALFTITRDLFNQWIQYLGANVIQIIVVFGFLYFASQVDFYEWIFSMDDIVRPWYWVMPIVGNFELRLPPGGMGCSICQDVVVPADFMGDLTCPDTSVGQRGIPPYDIMGHRELMVYLITKGVALFVITKALENMLDIVPSLAQTLGGARFTHMIAGAPTFANGLPNPDALKAPGMQSLANAPRAFNAGWQRSAPYTGLLGGMKEMTETVFQGKRNYPITSGGVSGAGAAISSRISQVQNEVSLAQRRMDAAESDLAIQQRMLGSGKGNDPALNAARLTYESSKRDFERSQEELYELMEEYNEFNSLDNSGILRGASSAPTPPSNSGMGRYTQTQDDE